MLRDIYKQFQRIIQDYTEPTVLLWRAPYLDEEDEYWDVGEDDEANVGLDRGHLVPGHQSRADRDLNF